MGFVQLELRCGCSALSRGGWIWVELPGGKLFLVSKGGGEVVNLWRHVKLCHDSRQVPGLVWGALGE